MINYQKTISHNSLIALDILLSEFIYNDCVRFLTFINFNNYKYFIIFKDDFIYYFKIYCIHYKNEIFIIFLRFKIYLKFRDYRINRIHFNNKNKYINKAFFECLI